MIERPDIEAIAARLAAALPGPWFDGKDDHGDDETGIYCNPVRRMQFCFADVYRPPHGTPETRTMIIHAPTDLAALLAYIAALEEAAHLTDELRRVVLTVGACDQEILGENDIVVHLSPTISMRLYALAATLRKTEAQ